MGKLSRYDAGEPQEDKKKKKVQVRGLSLPSKPLGARKPVITENLLPKKSRSISNRIRDAKRSMAKVTTDEAREALERKLYGLQKKVERNEEVEERKRLDDRNRKSKFLDTKRLEKRFKKAKDDEEVRTLIMNDMEYIKTFPRGRKYLSLFDKKLNEEEKQERDALRRKAAVARASRRDDKDGDRIDDDFFAAEEEDDKVADDDEISEEGDDDE